MKTKYIISSLTFMILAGLPSFISAQVVNMNNGIQLVAQGNISLVVDSGGLKNDGIFIPANSTVFFSGPATTAISGSQPITFYNTIFKGTGTKTNNGNASVIGTLGVEGTTVLDADGAANDKSFIIKSSDTATARVDILTTGNVVGDVTVERFINTGTNAGEHAKSWQFLATPTTGQSYFQSWQEGGLAPAGFGTWVTGTGTGFDAITLLPSLKFYDQVTGNWTAVTNTGNSLQNKLGYMLFVRGDRSVTTYNGLPNNTNMRSKGVLFTPFNPPPAVPVLANQFQSFGNPYASRIAFSNVYSASTGIKDVFYVWDPKLNGTYNVGGYQTLSGIAGYVPSAGSATTYYPAGVPSPFIESGQAVFVQGNVTGGNVNFNENCKVANSRLVNRPANNNSLPANRQFLFASLFTQSGMIADGNIVAFENGLGNELNKNDAGKILNSGENFGIARDGKLLSVEARNNIIITDTIFYDLKNLKQQPYQFRFAPVNMSAGITTAFLVDKFNNNYTTVNLSDSSFIDFNITGEPGSKTADRFMLVFRKATVVPIHMISISASRNADRTNLVSWKVGNEINLDHYVIERSSNGTNFNEIGIALPVANTGSNESYHYRDESPLSIINFYRIRAISTTGEIQYSDIVKLETKNADSYIAVFPNPVTDKTIHITFRNQQKGNYFVQISNKLGQVLYSNTFYIDHENFVQAITTGNKMPSGTYQLSITKEDGTKTTEEVVVK